ncbi:GNAT family N-acetyltransferase [Mailhella sp.]|uniref:GNAT family N-acetyltransferase n=1 Tax=Mailhella sp. TaxID=1981029 RepID=UPI0040646D36
MMIRPFLQSDTDEVAALWLRALRASHAFLPPSFWGRLEQDIRTLYLPMSDETVLHIDDAAGRIDAFIAFAGEYLGALVVDPQAQGRGLGSRMFRIARRMHPALTLTVYRDNVRAVEFYRRHGLAVYAERRNEDTGHVEYLMGPAEQAAISSNETLKQHFKV